MEELKTTLDCLSTAYHLQSDGNTKRFHHTIEQNLRAFVHTNHFGWISNLSLDEFAYNNNVHSITMYSPFVSKYSFDPRTPYNLIEQPLDTNKDSDDVLDRIMTVHSIIIDQ